MGEVLKKICLLGLLLLMASVENRFSQINAPSESPTASVTEPGTIANDPNILYPRDVTVRGLTVHYVESGTGPTVVLIHGNAGGIEDFEFGAIGQLSPSYHVIAIDRPGHGGSDRPEKEDPSVEFQAKFLHETMAALGEDKPILIGHSWGAAVALAYSLSFPKDLAGLVLLAPAAYPDGRAYGLLRMAARIPVINNLCVLLAKSVMGRGILKKELDRAFYPQKTPDKYFKMVKASWFGRKQLRAYFEDESSLNVGLRKITSHYPNIKVPVVIVTGDQDNIVSAKDNAYRLKAAIHHSKIVILKNTGHEIPQTHPESILQAINLIPKTGV